METYLSSLLDCDSQKVASLARRHKRSQVPVTASDFSIVSKPNVEFQSSASIQREATMLISWAEWQAGPTFLGPPSLKINSKSLKGKRLNMTRSALTRHVALFRFA
jgi:hypothetical protein